MSNIKDKLFSDYKKERLTLFNMSFILLVRMIGYVLLAILVICLLIGLILSILIASFRAWVLDALWEKRKWRFCGEMSSVMIHEIDRRIKNIIEKFFFAL